MEGWRSATFVLILHQWALRPLHSSPEWVALSQFCFCSQSGKTNSPNEIQLKENGYKSVLVPSECGTEGLLTIILKGLAFFPFFVLWQNRLCDVSVEYVVWKVQHPHCLLRYGRFQVLFELVWSCDSPPPHHHPCTHPFSCSLSQLNWSNIKNRPYLNPRRRKFGSSEKRNKINKMFPGGLTKTQTEYTNKSFALIETQKKILQKKL